MFKSTYHGDANPINLKYNHKLLNCKIKGLEYQNICQSNSGYTHKQVEM